jgi:hypothetical protein
VRYSYILEELEIDLTHSSLCQVLCITKTPAYCHRIDTIYIHVPELLVCPEDNVDDDSDDEDDKSDEDNSDDKFGDAFTKFVKMEALETFQVSSEAVHLLAEGFRHLVGARHLHRIELCSDYGHDLVLNALQIAQLSPKLAHFPIGPNHFNDIGYGSFSRNPQVYSPYIKGLQVQPFLHDSQL